MLVDPVTNLYIAKNTKIALFVLTSRKDAPERWELVTLPIFGTYDSQGDLTFDYNLHNNFLAKRLNRSLEEFVKELMSQGIPRCLNPFMKKTKAKSNYISFCVVDQRVWEAFSIPEEGDESGTLLEMTVSPTALKLLGFVEEFETNKFTHPKMPDYCIQKDSLLYKNIYVRSIEYFIVSWLLDVLAEKENEQAEILRKAASQITLATSLVEEHFSQIQLKRELTKKAVPLDMDNSDLSPIGDSLYGNVIFEPNIKQLFIETLQFTWTLYYMSITLRPMPSFSTSKFLAKKLNRLKERLLNE